MRRIGNLADQILSYENFCLAWVKASRGKGLTTAVKEFSSDLTTNLAKTRQRLASDQPEWGQYYSFRIKEPKERIISAASFPERVMHHALINILDPVFERHLIDHTYACRKKKGTHAAVLYALRSSRPKRYFAKLDIRKYFDSIDHARLKSVLRRLLKDRRVLFWLDGIIDSYQTANGKGLPIGNLTSQYFANYYLSFLDHYVLEHLHPLAYLRYMDDFVIWADSGTKIQQMVNEIAGFLTNNFKLNLKQPVIGPIESGLPFLGFLIKPTGIFLTAKSRKRIRRRALEIEESLAAGIITEEKAGSRVLSVLAAIKLAKSFGFRYNLWHEAGHRFEPDPTGREV